MIQLQNLYKHYRELIAVDDLSLEISTGEALGLLGPNGAGKSTTIGMMIGLIEPDRGMVVYNASSGAARMGSPTDPGVRRSIGLAPQALSLYEDLTARENLEFFSRLYDLRGEKLRQRVQWALDFAGLASRARDYVRAYSGGMKRRLNLACALLHQPSVVLLDEPTVGVDPQSRNHLFDCIEQLKTEGLTIIYTTHYMEEASRLCDRVAIIDHGKLLAVDTVEALIDQYGGASLVVGTLQRVLAGDTTLPGTVDGLDWRVETDEPMAAVTTVARKGVDFQSLAITRPDLESVFLNLTGRTLRD